MIFKTLFTPGHKHEDPTKRKASIAKLDPKKDADKRILRELAFNEENDAVVLAALERLDSFILWMKSADTSHSQIIKKKSLNRCLEDLEREDKVKDSLFEAFVTESKNKAMLSTLLFTSERLRKKSTLSLKVLFSIDNEQANRRFFMELANEEQQLKIVDMTSDLKLLTKFSKHSQYASVRTLIAKKLEDAELRKLMPAKVKQSVILINSRLLALKDSQDYEHLTQELTELSQKFDQAKGDFVYLDEGTSAELSEKYLSLKRGVEKRQAQLALKYKEQIALQHTTDALSEIQERLAQIAHQLSILVASATTLNTAAKDEESASDAVIDTQVKILNSALHSANEDIAALDDASKTAAHKQLVKHLQAQSEKMSASLQQIPEIIRLCQSAQAYVETLNAELSQYASTDKVSPETIDKLERLVKTTQAGIDNLQATNAFLLPSSNLKGCQQAIATANKRLKAFKAHYLNIQRKCENKLKVVNSLIADGKYKPAMATFYYVQKLFEMLPAGINTSNYARLLKSFEGTQEEIQKLQDWQSYIAQPRKPALLEEAKALASAPMIDAYERVDAVKKLRAQWSSFGQLHTDEDDAINKAFDEEIEKAFAPCRVFFADLEKLRDENTKIAQTIIQEARNIDAQTAPADLAGIVGGLKSRFSKVGELDKTQQRKLKRDFSRVLAPINQAINDFYASNAAQKQKLVDKAAELLQQSEGKESLKELGVSAKALQKQWKLIGFAGRDKDSQLWQAFRQQNDEFFNRYHEHLSEQQAQQSQKIQLLDDQVVQASRQLKAANAHSDLAFFDQTYQTLEGELAELDEKSRQRVSSKLSQLDSAYREMSKQFDVNKVKQERVELFTFLKSYHDENDLVKAEHLSNRYKSWLRGELDLPDSLHDLSRDELVQVALIINNQAGSRADLPKLTFGDENRRKQLQMQLMAAKLEGRDSVTVELVLAAWVSQGHLKNDELAGLEILESIFV